MSENMPDMLWCIEANIIETRRYGEEGVDSKDGTKLFRGGAKVYIIGAYYGMSESVVVIGHHRKSIRPICSVVKAKHLKNFKVMPIYKPKLREIAQIRSIELDGARIPIKHKIKMKWKSWQQVYLDG